MNLTDLQVELRSIEDHISNLHNEIEKMKPKPEEEKKADFEQITKLAEKSPIIIQSILQAPTETKKMIISSLAYILLLEEADFYNRLLYLCRLAKGCGYDIDAESIYQLGLEFEMTDVYKLHDVIFDYRYTYLIQAFIIANLSEEASVNMLSMIADIAQMLEVEKEQLRVLGMTAKAVLINDMDYLLSMPTPSKNIWSGKLRDYLSKKWIEDKRCLCGTIYTKRYVKKTKSGLFIFGSTSNSNDEYRELPQWTIKRRVKAGSIVKKGDIICEYIEKEEEIIDEDKRFLYDNGMLEPKYVSKEKSIVSPCDGMVYFVDGVRNDVRKVKPDEFIAVFVVSYFDDYSEFEAWYKKRF